MKTRTKLLALAAILAGGVSAPALADYARIGSVDVGFQMDRDTTWSRFGGHMEGLRLEASASDIMCRNIRVHFHDGETQNVFQGLLREGMPIDVDLRGGARLVDRIDFTCRSDRLRGGRIFVAADVGRFRAEWQRSPDWALYWSRLFNWGNMGSGGEDPNYWVSLGRERFQGRRDTESEFAGWGGRSVDRIGLRAVDGDARCTRVTVRFGNGSVRNLDVGSLSSMNQGRVYRLDLPGGDRNVVRVGLACRALGDRAVTIEILARK